MADFIAIGIRALSYITALQAAGTVLFLWLFDAHLSRCSRTIRDLAVRTAVTAIILAAAHQLIEPARLAGELSGVFDGSLQLLLLSSTAGSTAAVRILGLVLIVFSSASLNRFRKDTGLVGATLIVISFAFMGHTAAADERWLLAPILSIHLGIVAFWFGALIPLNMICRAGDLEVAGRLIERFSSIATWLVPIILIAGIALAAALMPSLRSFATPYGALLIAKVMVFALLMALASINKWHLGPQIIRRETKAVSALRRSVAAEWTLMASVIAVTAIMTAQFSPAH